MPHGLFTRYARPRFVAIHQDLLDICDGQHCEAALLHEIEFICAGVGVTFCRSLEKLSATILGLYSRDRVRQAISWLQSSGFIESVKTLNKGEPNVWRLDVAKVDLALVNSSMVPWKNQQVPHGKTNGGVLKNQQGGVEKPTGPSLVGVKDSKDLKDSPLPPTGGDADSETLNVNDAEAGHGIKLEGDDAEIVSYLHDQALLHSVKFRPTGKQKDWLRENASDELRLAALAVMATHRGRRINVTETIMAAVGYSGRQAGPSRGPGGGRQFTPRTPKPKWKPPGYDFETKLLADGKISQKEWDELRAKD